MELEGVKFTKVRSATDTGFWAKFAELKLNKFKLDDKLEIPVWASYSINPTNDGKITPLVLDCTSFNEDVETTSHNEMVSCRGILVNTNTYESFRATDPEKFIDTMGQQLFKAIMDGSALREPGRLTLFVVLSHADLKRYRFHYWTAHPTSYSLPELYHQEASRSADIVFTANQLEKLRQGFLELDSTQKCFFTVLATGQDDLEVATLAMGVELVKTDLERNAATGLPCKVYFGFFDPCVTEYPGWPLRNLLCLLFWHCPRLCFEKELNIVSLRDPSQRGGIVYTLKAKDYPDKEAIRKTIFEARSVGWESNASGKMGPNIADLSDTLDPVRLSERAVDLNLKLMKWRLVPGLDLEGISGLRCLLLGAGTLGCAVARVLVGWAVNTITFVDSSTVGHSNPVRQSLFTHQDAVEHRQKAYAARDALLKIRPSLKVEGVVLHIPMPGHVVGPSMMETTRSAAQQLEKLVARHDVVFLVLDSREARWLPTVLCAAMNKLAINAALGFDSYTVQRHGTRTLSNSDPPVLTYQNPSGRDLGCYFCNDVTQPGNSQVDRTLDQQCTVSRPGLSQIAAGLAVELMVSLTQHPQRAEARALMGDDRDHPRSDVESEGEGLLGGVPHTLRGSLWSHEMRLTVTHRFPACTACSVPVIADYRDRGFDFVLDACNQPNFLERLSGIEELLKRPDLDELCYAMDSSSEDENVDKPEKTA